MNLRKLFFIFGDESAQLFAGPVYLGFDRSHREREFCGDLFVREFTEETEFDQFAVARRHFRQQSFQLNLALVRDQVLLGGRASEGAGYADPFADIVDRHRIVAPAPRVVDERIPCDRIDPLAERETAAVTLQIQLYFDERLLQ